MKFYGKTSTLIAVGVALIMGAGVAVVYQWYAAEQEKTQQLEERIAILTQQTKRSAVMQRVNEQMEEIANQERRISDEQRIEAEKQTAVAEQMRRNAEEERQNALEAEHRAVEASKVAQSERVIAEQQRAKAEYQKRVADTLSYITLARQLGDVSIKQSESGNQELSQLLAYASQLFNTRYNGDVYTSSVYQSLVIASQSKQQWTTHKGGAGGSGYGELMKHRQTDDKISTEVLVNNSTYDFRDTYVDRTKGIVYAISRTGHFLIIDNHNTTELLVNNIGALQTMEVIGKQAGADMVISGVRPAEKGSIVQKLSQKGRVIMIGDGINDAPALTAANVGIAIGAGADVAVDAADVVLIKSRLTDAAAAIRLSAQTYRNIKENLFWALFYNVLLIPVAAGAYSSVGINMSPIFGAAAMSMSSVFVISNALRLNLFRLYSAKHDSSKRKGKK